MLILVAVLVSIAAILVGALLIVGSAEQFLGGPYVRVHAPINALLVGGSAYAWFLAEHNAHSPSAYWFVPSVLLGGLVFYGVVAQRALEPISPAFRKLSRGMAALYGGAIVVIAAGLAI